MKKVCVIKNLFLTLKSEIIFFNLKHIVMKKVYLFISLMLSALAVGCNTSDQVEDTKKPGLNNKVVVTVNATLPGDLTWVAGDKVAINGLESEAVAEEKAGLSTASFSLTGVEAPLVVVAPYEVLTGRNEVTLPSSQSYNAEGVDRSAYAMAAIAPEALPVSAEDDKNLVADVTLAPVVGVVTLPLTLDPATAENPVAIKSISFTAENGAALNGTWTAESVTTTDEAGVVSYDINLKAVKNTATTVLYSEEGVAINADAPVYFNLVVPAGLYNGGFEVVVTDTEDHNFVLELAEDVAVERGVNIELAPSVFTVVEKAPATLTVKIGESGVVWNEGDAVVCNNTLSTNTVDAATAGTSSASFNFEAVAYPYSVFYPADFYTTSGSLRFYDEQALIKNSYDKKQMVMAGYSTTTEVTLNNLCGVVSIPVINKYEGEVITIDKIVVRTSEGDPITGKYHINYRTGAMTAVAGKAQITLLPEAGAFTINPEETASINFVVPKGAIRNGLVVDIQSNVGLLENHRIFPTGLTVRGGETSTADMYEYKEIKIEKIVTAEELIEFAKCVNIGRYKKFINADGKVVLGGDIDMSSISAENWPMIKGVEIDGVPAGFDGIFDGCGFALKNWTATMPLFHSLAATGKISNLVIDSSCDLVVPAEPAYSGLSGSNAFAFIVAHLAGEVENVTNNADAHYVTSNHPGTVLGLISGNPVAGANVRNCVNNGDFTLEIANHKNGTGYIGTVCGRMIQDADHQTCGIFNCKNYGDLTITIVDANTNANLYIAAVTGSSNSYTVTEGCENYGNLSFVTESSNNAVCLAGITSYSAGPVRNCINEGNISFYSKTQFKGTIMAGIGAYINGPVTDCVNKGAITLKAEKAFAGRNTIGSISTTASSSSAAPSCAGICSYGYSSAGSPFYMERCSNYGKITFLWTDASGSGTSGYPMAAGVVAAPRGDVTDCHNYGDIEADFRISTDPIKLISYYGGVVAADVYAVKEQSSTSVYNCTNSGNITVHNDVCNASNNALGGIIGWPGSETKASCTNETKGCTNTGSITISGAGKFRCGGIQGGSGRVIDCVNSGNLTINSSNAGSTFGGLAGFHSGGYELTGSTNTGNVVANCVLASGGVGGMAGNLGNSAHAAGLIANNTINCVVKAPEGTCGVGMVCGHFNGKTKVINFGTAESPIKVAGSIQIGDALTVVDATNVTDPAVLGNHCSNYDAAYHIYNCVLAQ